MLIIVIDIWWLVEELLFHLSLIHLILFRFIVIWSTVSFNDEFDKSLLKIFRPENLLLDDASHVKIADFGRKNSIQFQCTSNGFSFLRFIQYDERWRIIKNIMWFTKLCRTWSCLRRVCFPSFQSLNSFSLSHKDFTPDKKSTFGVVVLFSMLYLQEQYVTNISLFFSSCSLLLNLVAIWWW